MWSGATHCSLPGKTRQAQLSEEKFHSQKIIWECCIKMGMDVGEAGLRPYPSTVIGCELHPGYVLSPSVSVLIHKTFRILIRIMRDSVLKHLDNIKHIADA